MQEARKMKKLIATMMAIFAITGVFAETININGDWVCQVGDTRLSDGNTYIVSGEFKPAKDVVIDGSTISCSIVSMINGKPAYLKSGSLIVRKTDHTGMYGDFIDIPVDSTASLTVPYDQTQVYSIVFGNGKYTFGGEKPSEENFLKLFDVQSNVDGSTTICPVSYSANAPEFASSSIVSGPENGTVEVSAAFTKAGSPAASVYLVWGTADLGRNLSAWGENKTLIGEASEVEPLSATFSAFEPLTTYVFRMIAVSGSDEVSPTATTLYTRNYGIEGSVNEWLGTTGSWEDSSNWSLKRVPSDTDYIWVDSSDAVITKNSGHFTVKDHDYLHAGTINLSGTGELRVDHDHTLSSFTISCYTILFTGNPILTLKGSHITARRYNNTEQAKAGIYPTGANEGRVNFISSSKTSSYTYIKVEEDPYNETFFGGKFLYNGSVIDNPTFQKTFQIATSEDPVKENATDVTLTLPASVSAPSIVSYAANYTGGAAVSETIFSAVLDEDSPEDTVVNVFWDVSDHEHNTSFGWPHQQPLVKQSDGSFSLSLTTMAKGYRYYFLYQAYSASVGLSDWKNGVVVVADKPTDATVWLGVNSSLTDPQNWSQGVPTAGSVVELNELFNAGADLIEWDVDAIPEVAGWRQYGRPTVVFNTTTAKVFSVSGSVTLQNGANWTHKGPMNERENPIYILNVNVGGDMTIGANSYVQAGHGDGGIHYRGRGYRTCGPSFVEGLAANKGYAFAFAGEGGYQSSLFEQSPSNRSYGSILNPLEWGITGNGDNWNENFAGGGVVKMVVAGSLIMNGGSIESRGFGWPGVGAGGASSGGSINITTAAIEGQGSINANGGNDRTRGNGCGGRIRVKLTESELFPSTVTMTAFGGTGDTYVAGVVEAAAGTIFLQKATDIDNTGLLKIANNVRNLEYPAAATHLPSFESNEKFSDVDVEVASGTNIRIMKKVGVRSLKVSDQKVPSGEYSASQLNALVGSSMFFGDGILKVGKGGLVISIR